jgi:hypothetical protein
MSEQIMNAIKQISRWIDRRYSTPWMLILLLVVLGFFWLFNFSPLPISNSEFIKLSGHEGLLDAMPFYSAQEAYGALTHYGATGRKLYLKFLAADFLFILVYSLAFALLMTRTVRAVCGEGASCLTLNVLPLGIGLFDCVENLCILGMLLVYPVNNTVLGTLSGAATLCKWLLTLAAISCLLCGSIVLLIRRLGSKPCHVQQ